MIQPATLRWQEFGTGLRAELERRGALDEAADVFEVRTGIRLNEPVSPEIVLVCPELRLALGLP